MKFNLISSDTNGWSDGVTWDQLFRHMPVGNDIPVVVTVTHGGFKFNHDLNQLAGKKYVHIDYTEWGWQWDFTKSNVFGESEHYPGESKSHEWGTLHGFIRDNPPALTFQRELRKVDVTPTRVPIDFLSTIPVPKLVTKAEYDSRPFQVFYYWGFSHANRSRIHGDIFEAFGTSNIEVVDGYDKVDWKWLRKDGRVWLTVFSPHWWRRPMKEVMSWQAQAKISICPYGAGAKAFRHAEAPVNCIMAQQENCLAWSYPWDETNSVRMQEPHEVKDLLRAVERTDLYDVYLRAQENIDRYRIHRYLPEYIVPNIERVW